MPDEPPHGVKFSTKACTASTMPMVDSAKNGPRSRRMPTPKMNASTLTPMPGGEQAQRRATRHSELTSQTQM